MSDLTPLNGGKKSKVLEEQRMMEARKLQRRRQQELRRRQQRQHLKRTVILSVLIIFIAVCIGLIVVNVHKLLELTKKDNDTTTTPVVEEETTGSAAISDEIDLSQFVIDDDMRIYDNDPELLQQLKDRLYSSETEDEKLEFIIENQEIYPPEMIEFLVKYEEVIDFVLKYPVKIKENHSSVVDISDDFEEGTVPTFIQWDDRWGYIEYGDNVIGDSGCGPTCLAMAAVALTGRSQYTPIMVSQYAEDNGYYVDGVGTAWSLMESGVRNLGLESEKITISKESLRLALNEDKLVILSMGPGIFTTSGHFILVYKYYDGEFYVKDPNSRLRSDTGYTFEEIEGQIKSAWAISAVD